MDTTKLIAIVTIILTLSVASERLVEIIKGRYPKFFGVNPIGVPTGGTPPPETGYTPEQSEARRKARISLLAVGCGIFTALLASPLLIPMFSQILDGSMCNPFPKLAADLNDKSPCGEVSAMGFLVVIAAGLLASGGSAFWNTILEYLMKIKDLKKIDVKKTEALGRIEVERRELDLANAKKER